jgi:RsiW-degrading membrane proteinase PrsW (M82 family)
LEFILYGGDSMIPWWVAVLAAFGGAFFGMMLTAIIVSSRDD